LTLAEVTAFFFSCFAPTLLIRSPPIVPAACAAKSSVERRVEAAGIEALHVTRQAVEARFG
jgi:hypothetical protein